MAVELPDRFAHHGAKSVFPNRLIPEMADDSGRTSRHFVVVDGEGES